MGLRYQNKFVLFFIIIFLVSLPLTSSIPNVEERISPFHTEYPDGYILYSPMCSTTTYQIDYQGNIIHTWPNSNLPAYSVYSLENGNILRSARHSLNAGGMVQEIAWNGDIIWQYVYDSDGDLSHHDIEPLPNGNVLMIAWETKTDIEAIAAGRDPNLQQGSLLMPDHIIEVQPTSPTSGDIVWEWHVWDHLVQDYDPSKENYGVVADHPELINLNFFSQHSIEISDWTHLNSVDYNEDLNQILLSSWYFNEIWVIDHSTTTEEAAGHTGGNSGRGGDLLYRWGNPQTYHAGTAADQKFFGQHDAQWIEAGCPGYGNILVFNNGLDRPDGAYSSIEELLPPLNQNGTYTYTPGLPYQPATLVWIFTTTNPTDFYSQTISGCQRLPNGNTLVCDGRHGIFFEVTPEKEIVWEYTNPYPNNLINQVFKVLYLPPGSPGSDLDGDGALHWRLIPPGSVQTGSFTIENIGEAYSTLDWEIISYPDWGTWSFTPASGHNLTPEEGPVTVQVEVIAPTQQYVRNSGNIKIVNLQDNNDYDIIPVFLSTPVVLPHSIQQFQYSNKLYHLFISMLESNAPRFSSENTKITISGFNFFDSFLPRDYGFLEKKIIEFTVRGMTLKEINPRE